MPLCNGPEDDRMNDRKIVAPFNVLTSVLMVSCFDGYVIVINPLNAELNPIRHLPSLVGAHHIVHVSRIRVKAGGT